ncbi:MAG: hypothetical protein EOO38_12720 [Cytophagaceae bacterium]|nr:MAG: hypothetical protein EOO38_12720 [Cytophagaceae bacterium]
MAKATALNYTPAQEAIISSFRGTGPEGKLTAADAATIAAMPEMAPADTSKPARTAKSITAKINTMKLPYHKKEATRKDGSAVETKAKLVAEIAAAADLTFEALENAARGDLVKLRDFLASKAA